MAMISCPNCGKEISDKAIKCPACGYELLAVEETTKCEECGQELPEGATSCPNCGCPVKVVENTPQRVSVANVELHHISKKVKKTIIAVVILAIVAIGAVFGIGKLQSSNNKKQLARELKKRKT